MRAKRGIIFAYKTYRGFPCPIVTLRLNGFDIEAYVDSGAFYSIFSSYEADVIGFSQKLGVGFNLLGRRSVFEKFVIVFDDIKEKITFIPR